MLFKHDRLLSKFSLYKITQIASSLKVTITEMYLLLGYKKRNKSIDSLCPSLVSWHLAINWSTSLYAFVWPATAWWWQICYVVNRLQGLQFLQVVSTSCNESVNDKLHDKLHVASKLAVVSFVFALDAASKK